MTTERVPAYVILAILGLVCLIAGAATIMATQGAISASEEATADPSLLIASPTPTDVVVISEATEAVMPPVQVDPVIVPTDLVVEVPVDQGGVVIVPSPDPNTVPTTGEIVPTQADPNAVVPIPTAMDVVIAIPQELPTIDPALIVPIPTAMDAAPVTDPNAAPPATEESAPAGLPDGVVPIPTAIDVVPSVEAPDRTENPDSGGGQEGGASGGIIVEAPVEAPLPTSQAPVESITQPTAVVPVVEPTAIVPVVEPTAISPVVQPTAIDMSGGASGAPEIVATAQLPVEQATTESITQFTPGQVSGIITFPMSENHTGISVTLTLPDGTTLNSVTTEAGEFIFPDLQPGSYSIEARHDGFLARALEFTLTEGQAFNLPASFLVAGDTDLNESVDLSDAALIALNFNGPAVVPVADLNRDGWIDVRDLALVGADFGLSGPIPWQ